MKTENGLRDETRGREDEGVNDHICGGKWGVSDHARDGTPSGNHWERSEPLFVEGGSRGGSGCVSPPAPTGLSSGPVLPDYGSGEGGDSEWVEPRECVSGWHGHRFRPVPLTSRGGYAICSNWMTVGVLTLRFRWLLGPTPRRRIIDFAPADEVGLSGKGVDSVPTVSRTYRRHS